MKKSIRIYPVQCKEVVKKVLTSRYPDPQPVKGFEITFQQIDVPTEFNNKFTVTFIEGDEIAASFLKKMLENDLNINQIIFDTDENHIDWHFNANKARSMRQTEDQKTIIKIHNAIRQNALDGDFIYWEEQLNNWTKKRLEMQGFVIEDLGQAAKTRDGLFHKISW